MRRNRLFFVVLGLFMLLFAGLVYAWSVLSLPLGAYFTSWSKAQLSLTFTICMMFFCLGGMAGGMAAKRMHVRFIIWMSGLLFLIGFLASSRADTLAVLYLGYGVLCGFASGLVYNAVLSTMSAWFPDKQGMISGVLLMAFGFSSFFVGKIYQAFTPSGEGVEAWRTSFVVFGGLIAAAFLICGLFFDRPRPEEQASLKELSSGRKRSREGGLDIGTREMVKRSSFWIFFLWTICIGGAGMALISQASGIAREAGPDVTEGTIATVAGLISIFNGIGRVFFGGLFDRKGRNAAMLGTGAGFAAAALILAGALGSASFWLVILGFICGGFFYGGMTPSISAYVNSAYGSTHYPVNFSVMNLNLLAASFGGTLGGLLYDMGGTYMNTIWYLAASGVVSLGITLMIRRI